MGPGIWMVGLVVAAATSPDSGGLTDPTRPVDYLPPSALPQNASDEFMNWHVTAVRIGKNDKSAVLNGKIVRAGDIVDRARIVEIGPGMIVVDIDRKRLELRLHGPNVKTQTNQKPVFPVQK